MLEYETDIRKVKQFSCVQPGDETKVHRDPPGSTTTENNLTGKRNWKLIENSGKYRRKPETEV